MLRRAISAVLAALSVNLLRATSCHAAGIESLFGQSGLQLTKSYLVEAGVVLALFGGAIFAVCRSSRRS
jgi:hypothetical protein